MFCFVLFLDFVHFQLFIFRQSPVEDSPELGLKALDENMIQKINEEREKPPVSNVRDFLTKVNPMYATSPIHPRSTHRDREVRDVYFERR